MLARVAIASNALDMTGVPTQYVNTLNASFARSVQAHGRLVFGDLAQAQALLRAVTDGPGLTPDARAKWREALIALQKTKRVTILQSTNVTALSDVTTLEELRAGWGSIADLAVVADDSCTPLGVPDSRILSEPPNGPDIATTGTATESPAITRLREMTERGITPTGSQRNDLWRDVIGPLAAEALTATVLDPYILRAVLRARATRGSRDPTSLEQISWLLTHLDNVMADGAEVRIITHQLPGQQRDENEIAQAIRTHWNPPTTGKIGRVALLVGEQDPSAPQKFPHDRHIRFSTGTAIEISAGLDRLREEHIWDVEGMRWTYRWRKENMVELKRTERRAMTFVQHQPITVVSR